MNEPSRYQFSAPRLLLRTIGHTFDYSGRSTRTEVVLWVVLAPLFAFAIGFGLLPLSLSYEATKGAMVATNVAFFVPAIALVARRLNDQDRSKWWLLLLPVGLADEAIDLVGSGPELLPLVDAVFNLVAFVGLFALMLLVPGTPGPNRFGPNPREVAAA